MASGCACTARRAPAPIRGSTSCSASHARRRSGPWGTTTGPGRRPPGLFAGEVHGVDAAGAEVIAQSITGHPRRAPSPAAQYGRPRDDRRELGMTEQRFELRGPGPHTAGAGHLDPIGPGLAQLCACAQVRFAARVRLTKLDRPSTGRRPGCDAWREPGRGRSRRRPGRGTWPPRVREVARGSLGIGACSSKTASRQVGVGVHESGRHPQPGRRHHRPARTLPGAATTPESRSMSRRTGHCLRTQHEGPFDPANHLVRAGKPPTGQKGTVPFCPGARLLRGRDSSGAPGRRGTDSASPAVGGGPDGEELGGGSVLHEGGVRHGHLVAHRMNDRRSWEDQQGGQSHAGVRLGEHVQHRPSPHRHVEGAGRLVGHQGRAGSTASARAIATRWRSPPDNCAYRATELGGSPARERPAPRWRRRSAEDCPPNSVDNPPPCGNPWTRSSSSSTWPTVSSGFRDGEPVLQPDGTPLPAGAASWQRGAVEGADNRRPAAPSGDRPCQGRLTLTPPTSPNDLLVPRAATHRRPPGVPRTRRSR